MMYMYAQKCLDSCTNDIEDVPSSTVDARNLVEFSFLNNICETEFCLTHEGADVHSIQYNHFVFTKMNSKEHP